MRALVLGGTGSIGSVVSRHLLQQGFDVYALSRSPTSAAQMLDMGAIPVRGDIRHPHEWIDCLQDIDAVIHAASTWGDDMDVVDRRLVSALVKGLETPDSSKALIYTGGCWLYGNTGDHIATENSPLCSIPSYLSTIELIENLLAEPNVRGMVVHPAMVYERGGGVFEQMYKDVETIGYARIFSDPAVRWPLIHKRDLAQVYLLMLRLGNSGDVFNASAIEGVAIGDIANAISIDAKSNSDPLVCDISVAISEFGDWAEGYALDQRISGQKARVALNWRPEHLDVYRDIYS